MRKSSSVRRLSIDTIVFGNGLKKQHEAKKGEGEQEGAQEEQEQEQNEEDGEGQEVVVEETVASPEISFDMNDQQDKWNERAKYNLKPFLPHLARSRQHQTPLDNSLPLVLGSLHFYMAAPPPPLSRELLRELYTRIIDDGLIVPRITYDLLLESNPQIYRALMIAICAMHKKVQEGHDDSVDDTVTSTGGASLKTDNSDKASSSKSNSIGQGEGLYYYYYCSSLGRTDVRNKFYLNNNNNKQPPEGRQDGSIQNSHTTDSAILNQGKSDSNNGHKTRFNSGIGRRFSQSHHSMVRKIGAFL